ncbi:hypothetical protein HELRODRAFT_161240 [Helobdella robusta]|uniref:Uncharacterized protein n=1 Tax=Helobdella robusta TaxID=6412 RepID=T1ER90_HELRO|nr:hypothetical protein HELRODRAFT_161240 [Helobdella robusta]ESO02019.1 hypothetical protein HELRODRAFT_161240 [Helobdella robusta]
MCILRNPESNDTRSIIVKVCNRNFLLLNDELLGSAEILLKELTCYKSPKTNWFRLQNQGNDEGEILLTLVYGETLTAIKENYSFLRKSTSFKNLAVKFGEKLSVKKAENEFKKRRESLCQMPRSGDNELSISKFGSMGATIKDLYWTPDEIMKSPLDISTSSESSDQTFLRRKRKSEPTLTGLRHTIDFSTLDSFSPLENVDAQNEKESSPELTEDLPNCKREIIKEFQAETDVCPANEETASNSKLFKTVVQADKNLLEKFDSYDSLQGSEEEYINGGKSNLKTSNFSKDKVTRDTNASNITRQLECYSKNELIQLVIDQREWIKNRELYILDMEAYMNGLLLKVLDENTRKINSKELGKKFVLPQPVQSMTQDKQPTATDKDEKNFGNIDNPNNTLINSSQTYLQNKILIINCKESHNSTVSNC